jgi:hypothetical protein
MNPDETSKESDKHTPLKQIRTYQGDMADAIRTQNESVVSIQRMEEVKHRKEEVIDTVVKKERSRFLLFLLGTMILTVGATAGGWFTYQEFNRRIGPPFVEIPSNRLIPSLREVRIDASKLSRDSLIDAVRSELSLLTVPEREVMHLVLTDGEGESAPLFPIEKFFATLKTSAPGSLVRALDPLFMIGAIEEESPSVFLIIRLDSFENTFAGMLSWEKSLVGDIGPLFNTADELKGLEPGTAFEDAIIKNKDVRAIYNMQDKLLLVYSYYDTSTLIITDNAETLSSIIARLNAGKLSK